MRMETSSPPPLLSQNSASFTIYLFDQRHHRITNSWKSGQRGPVFEIKGVSIIPEFALNIERKITFILFAGESWKFFFEIFIIRILSRETRGVSSNSKMMDTPFTQPSIFPFKSSMYRVIRLPVRGKAIHLPAKLHRTKYLSSERCLR